MNLAVMVIRRDDNSHEHGNPLRIDEIGLIVPGAKCIMVIALNVRGYDY